MTVKTKAMEQKDSSQTSHLAASTPAKERTQRGKVEGVAEFLGDIKTEFKKITWTSPEELRAYTKMVVGMTIFFGMGVYIMDLLIQSVLTILSFVMRLFGA